MSLNAQHCMCRSRSPIWKIRCVRSGARCLSGETYCPLGMMCRTGSAKARNWSHVVPALVARGRLLRLSKSARGEVLEARHDRVLYHLLAAAAGEELDAPISASHLSDPYFAEIVGMAVAARRLPVDRLRAIMEDNPLVAYYALKQAVASNSDYDASAATAIEQWIKFERHRENTFFARRLYSLAVLAEIDSRVVIDLTSHFPAVDRREPYFEARFRNGDVVAGFDWLTEYEFGVSIPGRRELVDRVRHKYGDALVKAVGNSLCRGPIYRRGSAEAHCCSPVTLRTLPSPALSGRRGRGPRPGRIWRRSCGRPHASAATKQRRRSGRFAMLGKHYQTPKMPTV